MADEFQIGINSGNWWSSSARNTSTPCSTTLNDVGNYGWSQEMEMKARSCEDSCNSMVYQDTQQRPQESDSSTLQMMGYSLSSPIMDWNQALINRSSTTRSSELNLGTMLQEEVISSSNFQQQTGMDSSHAVQKDWSPRNYSDGGEESSITNFKQINPVFGLDSSKNSGDCIVTCQGLHMNYPIISASTTLLPGLFEPDLQSQQSPYCMMNNYSASSSPLSYHMDLNELSPSFPHQFNKTILSQKPQSNTTNNQLHFSNNTPFWNPSADSISDIRSSYSVSPQSQFQTSTIKEKRNCSNMSSRKMNDEEVCDTSSVAKNKTSEPTFKRPRVETPSPLPTFKVRKEKLGDRITALQQLVSPFGKTDTASVLYEAIDYIKFLHEQVGVLSTPYMKNGAPPTQYQQQKSDKSKDSEALKQDLRSRGLCLVPISSTFPVTNETTADFWTPTFGGSYR
ncbi:Transcription factor bhlh [Thalictrum thalictroides]|uniref:Transcription factor bhlh n=1 Tax=Thalictrum thalictroides TaxID=46969 RepID=A0A7J6VKH0_THATH|nr:Transcription factor bhlh [Thalictrum thalictroides]